MSNRRETRGSREMSDGEEEEEEEEDLPCVKSRLLNAMKGMETASVGMRERRKEMRRAAPADSGLVLVLSLVSDCEATMARTEGAPAEITNFSVSAELMAPGLERTVLVWSSWLSELVSSVTVV